jgi:hypothetical protein
MTYYVYDGFAFSLAGQPSIQQMSAQRLAELGFAPLVLTAAPVPSVNHKLEFRAELVGDDWVQVWYEVPLTEAERTAKAVARADDLVRLSVIESILTELPDDDLDAVTYLFPEWLPGVAVEIAHKARFEGVLYEVIQAHTTQADWQPPAVPALWRRVRDPESTEWVAGILVAVGEQYSYQGVLYTVVQGHTTQAGWEPPNTPALWSAA